MDFAKLGLFKIIRVLELVIYKLDLSDSMRIIRICHILVLELTDPEVFLIKNIPNINPGSQEKVWEIKKIIDSGLMNDDE